MSNIISLLAVREKQAEDLPITEEVEVYDFKETQRRNKENKERLAKERLKDNNGVTRSYRLKK